LINKSNSF